MSESLDPSAKVLKATPQRALAFLAGVARNPDIQRLLAARGWSLADYEEGWSRLRGSLGYASGTPQSPVRTLASEATEAIDAWDEPTFRIAQATLRYRYPGQHAFLFAGDVGPVRGVGAILPVVRFLDRLDALERGRGRPKATRQADAAAVAALAKRGIGAAERKRVRALIEQASQAEGLAPADSRPRPPTAPPEEDDDAHQAALLALYHWLHEWSELARITIRRRDLLIRLGLASPRRRTDGKDLPAAAGEAK